MVIIWIKTLYCFLQKAFECPQLYKFALLLVVYLGFFVTLSWQVTVSLLKVKGEDSVSHQPGSVWNIVGAE